MIKLLLTTLVILLIAACNIQERMDNIKRNQAQTATSSTSENTGEVAYNQGLNQYIAGSYKDAIYSFEKAIEQSPQPKYHRSLGEALKADGRLDEAIAHMETAKELYQQQGDINAAQQISEQLQSWAD